MASKNGGVIKHGNGELKVDLPGVPEFRSLDPRNRLEIVRDTVKEFLTPSHGDDLHISFVNERLEGGAKVATMLRHGYRTLHWSEFGPKQLKQMRSILQRQPDDLVRFGDLAIMVCKEGVFQARQRFLDEESRQRQGQMNRAESAPVQSAELGVKVDDNPQW